MKKTFLTLIGLLLLGFNGYSQLDFQFTQYMFNRQAINPGYTGALETTNLTMLGRYQWVGIDGAPISGTFSGSGYIDKIKSGVGATILFDQLGTMRTMGGLVNYAFHLNMGKMKLGIGIEGGIYQKSIAPKPEWLYDRDQGDDPVVGFEKASGMQPDLGAGLYFHMPFDVNSSTAYPNDKFYLGLSAHHLLEPDLSAFLPVSVQANKVPRTFRMTGGYTFKLGQNLFLQPSVSFRSNLIEHQSDFTANLYVSPMVFALNYRMFSKGLKRNDSVSGILGFNATTHLFIGYSYDFTVSSLYSTTSGSHELIVSYTFPNVSKLLPNLEDGRGKPEF